MYQNIKMRYNIDMLHSKCFGCSVNGRVVVIVRTPFHYNYKPWRSFKDGPLCLAYHSLIQFYGVHELWRIRCCSVCGRVTRLSRHYIILDVCRWSWRRCWDWWGWLMALKLLIGIEQRGGHGGSCDEGYNALVRGWRRHLACCVVESWRRTEKKWDLVEEMCGRDVKSSTPTKKSWLVIPTITT